MSFISPKAAIIPPKADIRQSEWHVRYVPLADIGRRREQGKSGFRFSFPHYFLRDPLGDYLL
jgi:hypothetical protein